jgi:2-polyprenyl-3-methyl-5-hydroxy-6-metoxy-1,4-benzoquinol methylase
MGAGLNRVRYLTWAITQAVAKDDFACPGCAETNTMLVRRKYMVTSLRECPNCGLRFRHPKGDPETAHKFYVNESYKQDGLTTDIPNRMRLAELLETRFVGSGKDFASRIEDLRSNGVKSGGRVLDFGSSWGYGSWQMSQAGYKVFSYEIGKQRAQFAKDALGCHVIEDLSQLDGSLDCFFTSHVIEHLPDPNFIFQEAQRVLVPGGLLVCSCPNGAAERQSAYGTTIYDKNWGAVHPLMITPSFMTWAAKNHGFEKPAFRSEESDLTGLELLTIAKKAS